MTAKRPKLVYIHQYFVKPSMSGGIRSYEFSRRLARSGYDVHVVTTRRDKSFSGWEQEDIDGFHVHWISVEYGNHMGVIARLWAFLRFSILSSLKSAKLRPDVIFATSTPLTVAIPALLNRLFLGTPYVFEVRDLWPEIPIELGYLRSGFTKMVARKLAHVTYRYADSVVALSPDMKIGVTRYNVDKAKVVVIPNASDTELFSEVDEVGLLDFVSRYSQAFASGKKVVCYTGTLGVVNGAGYLVKVSQHLKEQQAEIAIVIFGDGAETDQIKAQAKAAGVYQEYFFIFSAVPKAQLAFVLSASAMSVSTVQNVPLLWSNSANKFFDAFAAGRPVAINYYGWQADIINKHGCGLVLPPNDPAKGARALAAFLSDERSYRAACLASGKLGKGKFSRDRLFSKLLKVIKLSSG